MKKEVEILPEEFSTPVLADLDLPVEEEGQVPSVDPVSHAHDGISVHVPLGRVGDLLEVKLAVDPISRGGGRHGDGTGGTGSTTVDPLLSLVLHSVLTGRSRGRLYLPTHLLRLPVVGDVLHLVLALAALSVNAHRTRDSGITLHVLGHSVHVSVDVTENNEISVFVLSPFSHLSPDFFPKSVVLTYPGPSLL